MEGLGPSPGMAHLFGGDTTKPSPWTHLPKRKIPKGTLWDTASHATHS